MCRVEETERADDFVRSWTGKVKEKTAEVKGRFCMVDPAGEKPKMLAREVKGEHGELGRRYSTYTGQKSRAGGSPLSWENE